MTEAELVAKIREMARDPEQRTSMAMLVRGKVRHRGSALPAPVAPDAVKAAEEGLGFDLPPLLGVLWTEVGNGGFGPGYGLFGLEAGHADDIQKLTLPELYLAARDDYGWEQFLGEKWPEKLVPVCDWGCQHQSAIDCSTTDGEVIDLLEGYQRKPRGVSFARWMEDWADGVDLGKSFRL